MTDKEIIKALEKHIYDFDKYQVAIDPCRLDKMPLDLIKRQQAEIERLEKENDDKKNAYNDEYCLRKEWKDKCIELLEEKQTAKSEAVKEFAERLKSLSRWTVSDKFWIDKLVEEMTDENND